jgi:hypothetical protein
MAGKVADQRTTKQSAKRTDEEDRKHMNWRSIEAARQVVGPIDHVVTRSLTKGAGSSIRSIVP